MKMKWKESYETEIHSPDNKEWKEAVKSSITLLRAEQEHE
jgi:hypothetical protein